MAGHLSLVTLLYYYYLHCIWVFVAAVRCQFR